MTRTGDGKITTNLLSKILEERCNLLRDPILPPFKFLNDFCFNFLGVGRDRPNAETHCDAFLVVGQQTQTPIGSQL
jgi:hypothetical protein